MALTPELEAVRESLSKDASPTKTACVEAIVTIVSAVRDLRSNLGAFIEGEAEKDILGFLTSLDSVGVALNALATNATLMAARKILPADLAEKAARLLSPDSTDEEKGNIAREFQSYVVPAGFEKDPAA